MTLCAAWVRKLKHTDELVMATDSRLRVGETWDGCPKLLTLPRSDAAICFAGSTLRAYPLMLQIQTAINSFPGSRRRFHDFGEMSGHVVRVINDLLKRVKHEVRDAEKDFEEELSHSWFIMGGYSWKYRRFRIHRITYDIPTHAYRIHSFKSRRRLCVFIGDVDPKNSVDLPEVARKKLNALLKERGKISLKGLAGDLNWEPFEVLRDIILEGSYHSVGGPPQVLKVYQHMNCQQFGIYWPSRKEGSLTLGGRPALAYEATDWPCLDAATLEISGIALSSKDIDV